jgi:hypothetical protein
MGMVLRYAASTLHAGDTEVILLLKKVVYWLSGIDGVSGWSWGGAAAEEAVNVHLLSCTDS